MEYVEALEKLKARLKCLENDASDMADLCDRHCDACDLNYAQRNIGEQKAALRVAIREVEKWRNSISGWNS